MTPHLNSAPVGLKSDAKKFCFATSVIYSYVKWFCSRKIEMFCSSVIVPWNRSVCRYHAVPLSPLTLGWKRCIWARVSTTINMRMNGVEMDYAVGEVWRVCTDVFRCFFFFIIAIHCKWNQASQTYQTANGLQPPFKLTEGECLILQRQIYDRVSLSRKAGLYLFSSFTDPTHSPAHNNTRGSHVHHTSE